MSKVEKHCPTCKHAEVDPWEEPCFKCQSVDSHHYLRWERRIEPPVVYPVGESPYLIKHTEPVCLSIIWDGPVLPKVGKQLTITAINRNFVTVKEFKPASMEVYCAMTIANDNGEDRSVSYDHVRDEYTIQGKRYAAGCFTQLLQAGQKFKVIEGAADTVTLEAYRPAILAEWQKKQLVDDVMVEWGAGGTHENMLVLVDKVLDAIGRRDDA